MAVRGSFKSEKVELGPCECPGSPHPDGDWAEVKDRLTFGDVRRISAAAFSPEFTAMLIARAITAWNLVDAKGDAVHVPVYENYTDLDVVDLLSPEQSQRLFVVVNADKYAVQLSSPPAPLPNPSGGPSADGSADGSPQTTPTSPTSSPTTP